MENATWTIFVPDGMSGAYEDTSSTRQLLPGHKLELTAKAVAGGHEITVAVAPEEE